jgi:hypothetical protein
MSKSLGVQYMYESQLAFVEVATGIFKVGKDKLQLFEREWPYVSQGEVMRHLNTKKKVCLCKGTLETIVHANFTIEETAEMKKKRRMM